MKNQLDRRIRGYLKIVAIQAIVKELYRHLNSKEEFYVRYPNVEVRNTYDNAGELVDDFTIHQNQVDKEFVLELLSRNIIIEKPLVNPTNSKMVPLLINTNSIRIRIIDADSVKAMYRWVVENHQILNYGHFALNLASGDAYYKDNYAKLHTSRGKFRVLKALLQKPDHKLSFCEIYALKSGEKLKEELSSAEQRSVYDVMNSIRTDLNINKDETKLLFPSDKFYILLGV